MKNKKGAVVSGLTTILVYFGFVLLLIIFFFIFKLSKGGMEVKISGHIQDVDVNYEVLNYLRMPVKFNIDGKEISTEMTDLIVKYCLEQDLNNQKKLQNLLQEKSEEIFNEKYPHLNWKIKVSDKQFIDQKFEFAETVASGQTTSELTKQDTLIKGMAKVCVMIPNPELKEPIKAEFNFLNNVANAFERAKYQSLKNNEFNC